VATVYFETNGGLLKEPLIIKAVEVKITDSKLCFYTMDDLDKLVYHGYCELIFEKAIFRQKANNNDVLVFDFKSDIAYYDFYLKDEPQYFPFNSLKYTLSENSFLATYTTNNDISRPINIIIKWQS